MRIKVKFIKYRKLKEIILIISELIEKLEKYAPADKAVGNEKVGLIIGNVNKEVRNAHISMTLTDDEIDAAMENDSNIIICFDSFVFQGIMNQDAEGRLIERLINNDISLYIVNSNLDVTENGFAEVLAKKLGIAETEIINTTYKEKCYKLVTCVPVEEENWTEQIRKALGAIGVADGPYGAGYIGTYSQVSDYSTAYQWFVTMPGADPHIGAIGDLSKVQVERFEMIIPEHQVNECVEKLWEIHPYEEVEYDVYPLEETRNHKGLGRIGNLSTEKELNEIVDEIKKNIACESVILSGVGKVKNIAIYSQVDDETVEKIIKMDADLLITDNIAFNMEMRLVRNGVTVMIIDEYSLKKIAMDKLIDYVNGIGVKSFVKLQNLDESA